MWSDKKISGKVSSLAFQRKLKRKKIENHATSKTKIHSGTTHRGWWKRYPQVKLRTLRSIQLTTYLENFRRLIKDENMDTSKCSNKSCGQTKISGMFFVIEFHKGSSRERRLHIIPQQKKRNKDFLTISIAECTKSRWKSISNVILDPLQHH